jgi:glycolate oxidase
VGALKADWLEREIGPVSLAVHRAIKGALDPAGILNPGTVFRAAPADLGAVAALASS